MSKEQNVFSFDLNETLFFEKGQEVSEMIGISLDPEISIQTFNEYVSIRGVIELNGEYQKANHVKVIDEPTLDFSDHHSRRYLERIEETFDGRAEFAHRFPVEITVPLYRVEDINDITVSIDYFDYELPNDSQLKLKSKINIYGIRNDAELPRLKEEVEKEEIIPIDADMEETFEFEIKKEDVRKQHETVHPVQSLEEDTEIVEQNDSETERWKYKKTQSFEEFFKDKTIPDEEVTNLDETELESNEVDMEVEESVKKTKTAADVDYLADMFRGSEDDQQQYTTMRICIVQEKETLEMIAERYQIPKLQLLKQNRLEDDDLLEGQLLSIPTKNR